MERFEAEKATAVAGMSPVQATIMIFSSDAVRSPEAARNPGALAQLGERLICIQEVIGSIPIGSTRSCEGPDGLVAQVVRAYA